MRSALLVIPVMLVISSCSSPPKPPTVDQSRKHPANSAVAIELQGCKSELHNTRIVVDETTRLAESASATATRLALLQQKATLIPAEPADAGNAIYTVNFAFGSAEIKIPGAAAAQLVKQARAAALVLLRGRTDGTVEIPAEGRIARERALAVRAYLIQSGVDPARIRPTWQAVGDSMADNATPAGRAQNRRVEIELYRSPPHVAALNVPAPL